MFSMSHMHENYYLPVKYKHISASDRDKIIQSLTPKDSHSFDEISNRILKVSALFILFPITYILNKALFKGIFPDRMKFSIIKPLYNNGSKCDMANYRPISLLISFSKIF
jgi:Notch-like protein